MVCEWTNTDEALFNGEYKPMVKTEAKKNNKTNNKPFEVQMAENKFIIQQALKNKSDIELKNYLLKRPRTESYSTRRGLQQKRYFQTTRR